MVKDYQRGKIYKIVCNITNKIYIGSTCEPTLARRLAKHVSNFNCWKKDNNKQRFITSFLIFENNDYYIELLEVYPCNIKEELLLKERYHIKNNICVNKGNPISTIEEKKEMRKIFIEKNKDKMKEYNDEYTFVNKNILQQQHKEYYEKNKDKKIEYQRDYHEKNKDAINARRRELAKIKRDSI